MWRSSVGKSAWMRSEDLNWSEISVIEYLMANYY